MIITSCSNQDNGLVIFDKSFEEVHQISKKTEQLFCVILYDSLKNTPKEYVDKLVACKIPLDECIYNFINITLDENKWYVKWASPQILPITCVFRSSGELIDIIPGIAKESLLYVNKVVDTGKPSMEFHYNQKYDKDKKEIIEYLSRILVLKFKVDKMKILLKI